MDKKDNIKRDGTDIYQLKLFVAGDDRNSRLARKSIEQLCETKLQDKYHLEIIDVLQDFKSALKHNVLVAPTLILTSTQPPTTIIGSLNDSGEVLKALGIKEETS
ncbi:MAG TPA: circadian clock protein KaiB [Desulfocapsa sulfexigens]|nr:circadian clock protein KaiB [Desulfocapsa sulfexigens]